MSAARCSSRKISIPLIVFISAMFLGCAEVGPPPGGEIDKSAPRLIASEPPNGAVNVPRSNMITLRFSERIVQPSGPRAIFISPRPQTPPSIKWKSDYVIIKFADSFATDQTYIISAGADIKDLRNNSIDSNLVIAFSTGATIDSGQISGHTVTDGAPAPGMLVALYDTGMFSSGRPVDSIYPTYLAQSNKDGYFSFQYLPAREYKLIAFADDNRNERFSPVRERFAVPDRPIIVEGPLPLDDIYLPVTFQDTTPPQILAASYTRDKLVRVDLSGEIDLNQLRQSPANFMVKSAFDTTQVFPARGFLEADTTVSRLLNFYVGPLSNWTYLIELYYSENRPILRYDSLRIEEGKDDSPPEVTRFEPSAFPVFLKDFRMKLTFSEPLDTSRITPQSFFLLDRDTNSVSLEHHWDDPFRLSFTSKDIRAGMNYRFNITEFDIADLAGNDMGDSLLSFPVNVLNEDSVGSVSGEIKIDIASKRQDPTVLEFLKIDNGQKFQFPVSGATFSVTLPAGKYFLSGFIDSNLNGIRDKGSIFPYRYSETIGALPDTVAVRARFETAGIEMTFR